MPITQFHGTPSAGVAQFRKDGRTVRYGEPISCFLKLLCETTKLCTPSNIFIFIYVCISVAKRFSTLSDTQTPLLPIFPLAFIQVSFVHGLLYSFHPVFLRSSSCSLLFWHPLQCYFGQSCFYISPINLRKSICVTGEANF